MNPGGYRSRRAATGVPTHPRPRIAPAFGPLEGLRVIDLGRYVAGPWAATYLGEFGAEIIHVEAPPFSPPFSDPTRLLPPTLPEGARAEQSVSESWAQYSRNKLSLALDIRSPDGQAVLLDLVRCSDILIESSRPGSFDRLGLGDARLHGANGRLTIVHVSGYGQDGDPGRIGRPSFDLVGQAYSGFLSLQGEPDPAPPMRAGTALNDTVTGLAAAAVALMGHRASERNGHGQSIDVAQYEVFFTLLENLAMDYFMRGVVRGRQGRAHSRLHPYDVHKAKDGWVVVAAPTAAAAERLSGLIGRADPRWADAAWRGGHRDEVDAAIAGYCAERTMAELERLGAEADVAIAPVRSIAELAEDPHYRARQMFIEWDDPVLGRVKGAGIAPKFSATPGRVWRGAPWLGQDNGPILRQLLGYSEERIESLRRSGVIGEYRPAPPADGSVPFFLRSER